MRVPPKFPGWSGENPIPTDIWLPAARETGINGRPENRKAVPERSRASMETVAAVRLEIVNVAEDCEPGRVAGNAMAPPSGTSAWFPSAARATEMQWSRHPAPAPGFRPRRERRLPGHRLRLAPKVQTAPPGMRRTGR